MNKNTSSALRVLLACGILAGTVPALTALEVSAVGKLGNLAFDVDRETPLGAGTAFEENLGFWGTLGAEERFTDTLSFSAEFERDPLLRNLVYTRVGFDAGFAKMSVGPFFGPFNNSDSILSSGLSTELRLELPGVIFGSFRADSTIGAGISAPGDYVQERSEIALGFWVPNVITTVRLRSDTFTEKKAADLVIEDQRTRYELVADVYKKNIPYTAQLLMGYQSLTRAYISAADTLTDELAALLLGFEVGAQVSPQLKLILGTEAPLYAWGVGDLASPSSETILYEVRAGAVWTFKDQRQEAAGQ